MAHLLVVTGPPGAGKSTSGRLLAERLDPSVLVAGDHFFTFLARGHIDPWRSEAARQNDVVIEAAARAAGSYAKGGYATVFEGVVGPWYVGEFLAGTGLTELDSAILLPSLETCVERVANRAGHGFTDEAATRSLHEQFATASIDDRHVFHDPPEDPVAVAELIANAAASGRLAYPGAVGVTPSG
jgi:cytidylate kinase